MTEAQQAVHILLVEDDPGDVLMTQEAFEHHRIRNPLHVVTDGAAALRFLRGEGEYPDAPSPGLILLDLNLPLLNGSEVLAEIKADVIRQIDDFFVTVVRLPVR
jgi:CheY-like chemotaxis protein